MTYRASIGARLRDAVGELEMAQREVDKKTPRVALDCIRDARRKLSEVETLLLSELFAAGYTAAEVSE